MLARQLERGPLIEPKPEIGEPDEPEPPEAFTLFDLIRMFAWAHCVAPSSFIKISAPAGNPRPSRSNSGVVARIGGSVAAI